MRKKCSLIIVLFLCLCFLFGCVSSDNEEVRNPILTGSEMMNKAEDSESTGTTTETRQNITMEQNAEAYLQPSTTQTVGDSSMNSDIPSTDLDATKEVEEKKSNDDSVDSYISELEGIVLMDVSIDSDDNLDITITNNSESDVEMGRDFLLQKKVEEIWEDVPLSINYFDDSIVVAPNVEYIFHYNIENVIVLERGVSYRIVKAVSSEQTNTFISTAFEIQ